jgi:hypothetical protein
MKQVIYYSSNGIIRLKGALRGIMKTGFSFENELTSLNDQYSANKK